MRKLILKHKFYALKSILIGFLVSVGMLIPFFIKATSNYLFVDTFEDYNLSTLNGQYDWVEINNHFVVINTFSHSGTHSIYNEARGGTLDEAIKYGTSTADGIMVFWFYLGSNIGTYKRSNFILEKSDTGDALGIRVIDDDNNNKLQYTDNNWTYFDYATNVSKNTWHKITIEWEFAPWHYKMKMDDGDFTSWMGLYSVMSPIQGLRFATVGYETWYDDIETTTSQDIIFTPIYPINCQVNIDPDLIFGLEGIVEIGTRDLNKYTSWSAHFTNIETGEIITKTENFEVPMDKDNNYFYYYWGTYNELTSGCWEVFYDLTGYNPNTMEGFVLFNRCQEIDKKTIIGNTACTYELPKITECPTPEYENCDELGLPEKWICKFMNMAKEILFPTCPKITELKNQLNSFKEKFPFNYLKAIQIFFNDLKTASSEEKGIPIKILGHETYVDFSIWDKIGSVGGLSEKISDLIKDASRLSIVIGFFGWLIYFIRNFF